MTEAARIIAALDGNEHSGMCLCPAHEDSTPSLHVSESKGKVLVRCFAGCSQQEVIGRLKEMDLWKPDGHSKQNRTQMREQEWEQQQQDYQRFHRARVILRAAGYNGITAPTDYLKGRGIRVVPSNAMLLTTEAAKQLRRGSIRKFPRFPAMVMPVIDKGVRLLGAHVIRLNSDASQKLASKRSAKRSYGPIRGGFIALSALDPDNPPAKLIVAEGVETALSAMQMTGLPGIACCGTSGLQTVDLPACGEVIIAADNDEPGLKAANALAQRLADDGRMVRIAIPENEGEDFNDVLCNDASNLEQVRRSILHAELVERSSEVEPLGMEAFMALHFPARDYLLKSWLTTSALVMIDGLPGHGKTILAMFIAYSVASGAPLLGWNVERSARVLYVDGELPGDMLQKRLKDLGPSLPAQQFQVLALSQFELRSEPMLDLGTEEGRAYLDRIIERQRIELIILDSLSTLVMSGMDNEMESWRGIQAWSLKHRARGRSVIYLHHHGRSGKPRGTSAREIVLDSRIKIAEQEVTDAGTAFRIEFPKHRGFHGAETLPLIAFLSNKDGRVEWTRKPVTNAREDEVTRLLVEGLSQAEVGRRLNISPGRVSQIVKEAKTKT